MGNGEDRTPRPPGRRRHDPRPTRAFALSFDEIIVTTFTAGQQQTLPIWIFSSLFRPRQRPVTNVVAMIVVVVTLVPIIVAQRLTRDTSGLTGRV